MLFWKIINKLKLRRREKKWFWPWWSWRLDGIKRKNMWKCYKNMLIRLWKYIKLFWLNIIMIIKTKIIIKKLIINFFYN